MLQVGGHLEHGDKLNNISGAEEISKAIGMEVISLMDFAQNKHVD